MLTDNQVISGIGQTIIGRNLCQNLPLSGKPRVTAA